MSGDLKKEVLGVGLAGIFIFLFVSLLSYHPFDPSLNTVTGGAAKNLCGRAGSYIADFFVQLFGMMSYLLCFFTLLFSLFYIRKKEPPHPLVLAGGLTLFFLSSSALFQIMIGKITISGVGVPFGGLLGSLLERALVALFSFFGSILIAVILLLISLFLIIQAPLLTIIEKNLARRKPLERRKEIKVTEEEREARAFPHKVEKKPCRGPGILRVLR